MGIYKVVILFYCFIGFTPSNDYNETLEVSKFFINNKIEQSPILGFFNGVREAVIENVKNIWSLIFSPIDSLIRILSFCKKIIFGLVNLIIAPYPFHVYLEWLQKKGMVLYNFYYKTPLAEKCKWLGFVSTDFLIGYFVAYGIVGKTVAVANVGVNYFNKIGCINRFSSLTINRRILTIIDSSNSGALINAGYRFEYADQFRQYMNDLIRHENY